MIEFGTRRLDLRIVFMGTPEFAIPSLEELVRHFQIVAVYTQPDKPAGRGRTPLASPVKKAALNLQLPVVQPVSLKSAAVVAQLADLHPDVIVVAAFGQILPKPVLDIPKYGCLNIHPSLLPKYRGASPVAAAILSGDEVSGVSIMLMEAGMDTGPVLAQEKVFISPPDTTGSLTAKLSLVAAQMLPLVLERWAKGEIAPRPQDEAQASYSSRIVKEDGEINWHLSAVELWRRVRAFQPWPGAYTFWQAKRLEIIEAVPQPGEAGLEVGWVVALNREGAVFGVNTGKGILGVLKVQLEGKRVTTSADFVRGQRHFIGSILPSS